MLQDSEFRVLEFGVQGEGSRETCGALPGSASTGLLVLIVASTGFLVLIVAPISGAKFRTHNPRSCGDPKVLAPTPSQIWDPRKALRTLNQKSFLKDFVNFWR